MWSPERYLAYADHRMRPALELLARIPNASAGTVVDLGCGPGNVTPYLLERWPDASYVGIDNSPEMLAVAAGAHPDQEWVDADAGDWVPDQPVDVIYSNAALHWTDDHGSLFPRLVEQLAPGGTLAVQMPSNFGEPTHTAITKVVQSRQWSVDLAALLRPVPVHAPAWYHELLSAGAASVDVWTTAYLQELSGEDPVTNWVRGSALRPFLTALGDQAEQHEFLAAYTAEASLHYKPDSNGVTLMPFHRLFIIAMMSTHEYQAWPSCKPTAGAKPRNAAFNSRKR